MPFEFLSSEMCRISTLLNLSLMALTIAKYYCMMVSLAWYTPLTCDVTNCESYLITTSFPPSTRPCVANPFIPPTYFLFSL